MQAAPARRHYSLRVPTRTFAAHVQPVSCLQHIGGERTDARNSSLVPALSCGFAAGIWLAGRRLVLRASRKTAARGTAAGESSAGSPPEAAPLVFNVVLASAIFMAFWIFLFPGSAWIGMTETRDAWLTEFYETYAGFVAPSTILMKYARLGSLAEWTHALPGGLWAILAPMQLHPELRKMHGGALHRAGGRFMLTCAAVLMVGFAIIDANNLFADKVDFAGHGGAIAEAADSFNAERLANALPGFNDGGVLVIAAWFIITGVQTFRLATAKPMDVQAHREWAIRHVASGLWVAAQRPLFGAARTLQALWLGVDAARTSELQGEAFYYSAYFVTALYILGAELVIRTDVLREKAPPAEGQS
eukprot:TRINITY_DN111614_c0_g1_i1.p1 TRINITY_DN111614_c0_g1~~TRINITY_DN111614_c0_g1_i1.p1  ORF type:complete len:361 (-),score=58.33 TRINITY_DN111614_c0_g1_i1:55-1137(-)